MRNRGAATTVAKHGSEPFRIAISYGTRVIIPSYWLTIGVDGWERRPKFGRDVGADDLAHAGNHGAQHGYGLARRIEPTSGDLLQSNYGTIYPALLKLEQEGYLCSHWGTSDNNRKARFYELTKAGLRQVRKAAAEWEQTSEILDRFLRPVEEV